LTDNDQENLESEK